jgi:hypothetical protein
MCNKDTNTKRDVSQYPEEGNCSEGIKILAKLIARQILAKRKNTQFGKTTPLSSEKHE